MKLKRLKDEQISDGYLQRQDDYPYEIMLHINDQIFPFKEIKKYKAVEMSHEERGLMEIGFKSQFLMWRNVCGETQKAVSEETKIHAQQLSRYDKGSIPSIRNVKRIAKALKLPFFLFWDRKNNNYLPDLTRYGVAILAEDILSSENKEDDIDYDEIDSLTEAEAEKKVDEFAKFGVDKLEADFLLFGFRHRKDLATSSFMQGFDEWKMEDRMFDEIADFNKDK